MLQPFPSKRAPPGEVALAAAIAVLCLIAAPRAARAQPTAKEKAVAKVAEGADFFEQGKFQEALAKYAEAMTIYKSARINYNMALAYLGMGRQALGFFHLQYFVKNDRKATPEYLPGARTEMERLADKIGFLAISSDVDGAAVIVDGHEMGSTPLKDRVPVEVGRREVVLRHKTWGTRTASVDAVAGKTLPLKIEFRSVRTSGSAATGSPGSPAKVFSAQAGQSADVRVGFRTEPARTASAPPSAGSCPSGKRA
jgi:hypothetical protein